MRFSFQQFSSNIWHEKLFERECDVNTGCWKRQRISFLFSKAYEHVGVFRAKYTRPVIQHPFILSSGFILPVASRTPTGTSVHAASNQTPHAEFIAFPLKPGLLPVCNKNYSLLLLPSLLPTPPTLKNSSKYLPKLFFSPWSQWSTFEPPLARTIASAFQVVSLLLKIVPTNSSSVPPEFAFKN